MRGDQPVCRAACPTVSASTAPEPYHACVKVLGAAAAVPVFEPHDVVEVRRRDLEDERVVERGDAVHGARPEAEGGTRADDLRRGSRVAGSAHLDLRAPL